MSTKDWAFNKICANNQTELFYFFEGDIFYSAAIRGPNALRTREDYTGELKFG